jgi:nephrocystin-3
MSTPSRTVRVFLSSTFRDFAEERDLLVRKVFPELRRKCRERQVELVDVDLRWGITEEEAQQGKVLPICLAEIDRSRPFFMGFIGERYGWIPEQEKYDLSFIMEQPWLDQHRGGKSVTELEMLHGVLNNPAMEDRAFFYFRDPKWSQKKGGAYLSEGSPEKEKLEALKDRIRQSGFPVVEDYPTPEALAERVKEDLWKLIDEAFPESEVPDALAQERMRHEAFAASRLGLYIGGERYAEALDAAISPDPRQPVLVSGASGGGKSALLANWARKFTSSHPEALVLTHFLGTGADAAHPVSMAIRIISEISRMTGEEFVLEGDPRKALRLLEPWLEKAGAFAREKGSVFVLVLDALDKMTEHRDLDWWPRRLPEGVALFASCLDGEIRDALLPKLEWSELRVSPLERSDSEKFLREHLAKYRKSLTLEQTALALEHPLCGNPLFLRTLLEELRVFGVHEEVNLRLKHYLASETIDDLFEKVLNRIESDNTPETVRAALEVLWAAKESFAEDELLIVSQLPPAIWAPIHIALDESLIGAGGRLAFSHDYLRKAVEDRYLVSEVDRQRIQNRMAEFCAQAMKGGRKETSRYARRHAVEHFLEAEDWDSARAALSDLEFIEARAIAQELPEMLKDYARAIQTLPEGQKEREEENTRQEELDRYAKDMADYAATWSRILNGGPEPPPLPPRPVPHVRLWSREETAAKRKQIKESPNHSDIIKIFRVFVGTNFKPLRQFSKQEGFVANLALIDPLASLGPIQKEGFFKLLDKKCIKFVNHFNYLDNYDPLPACQAILEGHEGKITDTVMTLDSRRIISSSADKTIRVWDSITGECTNVLRGHECSVEALGVSLDGSQIILSSSDMTLRIWDLKRSQCIHILKMPVGDISLVNFLNDGSHVILQTDQNSQIWNLGLNTCTKEFPYRIWGSSICGNFIAFSISDTEIGVWNSQSNNYISRIDCQSFITSVAFSNDGENIISGNISGDLNIWDISSGNCLQLLKNNFDRNTSPSKRAITSVSLDSSKTHAFSVAGCELIQIWDVKGGKCIKSFYSNGVPISKLLVSSDGRNFVTQGRNQSLHLWNARYDIFQNKNNSISKISSNKLDNCIAIACENLKIEVRSSKNGEILNSLNCKASIRDIAWDSTGQYIAAALGSKVLQVWDLLSGQCIKTLSGHNAEVNCLLYNHCSSRIVSGSGDKMIRIWDPYNGQCKNVLKGHTSSITCLAFSHDGLKIASGSSDKTIRIWDFNTGECNSILHGHANWIKSISWSDDGKYIVSGSGDKTLRIWDVKSEVCIKILHGHEAAIHTVGFITQSIFFSASLDETLRIWDLYKGNCYSVLFLRGLTSIALEAKRNRFVAGFSDGRFDFYHLQNPPCGPFISTAFREIISEDLPAGAVTARPPCCGRLISIPETISERIEHWSLDDIEGGHSDPALLLDCPHCQTPLRMNPFFVDVKPTSTI